VDPICAVCETQVTAIHGAPARQNASATDMPNGAFAWCKLLPCGHKFKVRAGELIH
jgi:hypothetical protein